MSYSVKILKILNKLFPLPLHPFNTQSNGGMSYAEWQYSKGEETIKYYFDYSNKDNMFSHKTILDVGCGAGGKSLYYLDCGADKVVGIDILPKYKEESMALARKLNLNGFDFLCEDASNTSFADNTFDTIIMNDAMEHVSKPEAVLNEMYRVLKPGGRLYVNFPPYNHPYGAHLSDAIGIPWVHILFSDKTLIKAYKNLICDKPNRDELIDFRIGKKENGEEYFSYINKMTIKRFKTIIKNSSFRLMYYNEVPLRKIFAFLCHTPLREYFVKMVVCIFEK